MKILIIISALLLSSCSQKTVMKDCEQINGGPYSICKKQSEID